MFDWIVRMVEQTGYAGVALLMFAENLFPPVPSELILPLAGFTAARGDLQFVPVVIAGTAGAVAGGLFWYLIGRWIGCDRLGSLHESDQIVRDLRTEMELMLQGATASFAMA
ncbi:DedA family protein [Azospirillum thiophilum]|uniref:DedA family protein n=1 Tax=Azospirillum thiophilum TaxID=528244 RepID=UPI00076220D0|nr:hypothetical protein [Azospirillum thiophilum]